MKIILLIICMMSITPIIQAEESIDGWQKAKWYMNYSDLSKIYNFSPSAVKNNIPGCKYTVILDEKAEINSLKYIVYFGFNDKLKLIDVVLSSDNLFINGNKQSKVVLSAAVLILDNNSKYGNPFKWKGENNNISNWCWQTKDGIIFFICVEQKGFCRYILAYSTPLDSKSKSSGSHI